jgi:hypothetical protein
LSMVKTKVTVGFIFQTQVDIWLGLADSYHISL